MKRRIFLLGVALLLAVSIGVGLWLREAAQPARRGEAAQPTVVVLRDVQPPVCTQDVGEQDCGAGVMYVRTEEGRDQTYRYDSATRIVASDARDVAFLPLGSLLSLTLSGDGDRVVEVRVLR